ncbi:MAG: ABC transporter permease [Betaproteobacteria bacterium]|nr:ABC transporter permease [Betaproteobacteria bacterium]
MNILQRVSSAALLAVLIAGWEIFSRFVLPTYESSAQLLLPPPSQGVQDAFNLMRQGALWQHVGASARRVYGGFVLAALIAIPLGILMGLSASLHRQLNPLVGVLRPIPPVAWIPITLLWFGVNDAQQYFIIFIGTFFPMLLNAIAGVRNIDPILQRAALSLGARPKDVFALTLRAALPNIFVGIRTSLALGWFIIIASEMVSASTGLGFLIIESRTAMLTERLYVGMFAIGLIGYLQDQFLLLLGYRLIPWA